jgi:hypothetical protein
VMNPSRSQTDRTASTKTAYPCDASRETCGCAEVVVLSSQASVHSEAAIPYSWSMAVSVRVNGSNDHACIGTILSPFFILTSSICLAGSSVDDISIAAGIHDLFEPSTNIRYATHVFVHPDQTSVAVIRIFPPLSVFSGTSIVRTCPAYTLSLDAIVDTPILNRSLIAISWTSTNPVENDVEAVLQQAEIRRLPDNDDLCQRSLIRRDREFCTTAPQQSKILLYFLLLKQSDCLFRSSFR